MDFAEEFIELLTSSWKDLGLDELSAKLIAIIYVEPQEISMSDLSKRTGYSLASISNKLSFLEGKILHKIKKPGSKKLYYSMDKDMSLHMKKKFELILLKEIMPMKEVLPGLIKKAKNGSKSDEDKKKVKIMEQYYTHKMAMEPLLKEMIKKIEVMHK